jgi:hypothetical protein
MDRPTWSIIATISGIVSKWRMAKRYRSSNRKTNSKKHFLQQQELTELNQLSGPVDPDDENSIYRNWSMQALQSRGVRFLSCHTAL